MLPVLSLSLLCLTFFATSAVAECEWVLWSGEPGEDAAPLDSFPTKEECAKRRLEALKARERLPNMPGLICLPNTFDPSKVFGPPIADVRLSRREISWVAIIVFALYGVVWRFGVRVGKRRAGKLADTVVPRGLAD